MLLTADQCPMCGSTDLYDGGELEQHTGVSCGAPGPETHVVGYVWTCRCGAYVEVNAKEDTTRWYDEKNEEIME